MLTPVGIIVYFLAMTDKMRLLLQLDVRALIEELDLEIGTAPRPVPKEHNLVPFDLTPAQRREQLCKDLYLRNRKFSRRVYPSYTDIKNKSFRPVEELSGTLW